MYRPMIHLFFKMWIVCLCFQANVCLFFIFLYTYLARLNHCSSLYNQDQSVRFCSWDLRKYCRLLFYLWSVVNLEWRVPLWHGLSPHRPGVVVQPSINTNLNSSKGRFCLKWSQIVYYNSREQTRKTEARGKFLRSVSSRVMRGSMCAANVTAECISWLRAQSSARLFVSQTLLSTTCQRLS